MRWFLAAALVLASPGTSSGQVPTARKDVAKLVRQLTVLGVTYRIYEYQGVSVQGEVSLQDYNDATAVVRRELRDSERIIEVVASQQVPTWSHDGKDLFVRTCTTSCGPQRVLTADGKIVWVAGGGEGRMFIFERVSGTLQLSVVWTWIA